MNHFRPLDYEEHYSGHRTIVYVFVIVWKENCAVFAKWCYLSVWFEQVWRWWRKINLFFHISYFCIAYTCLYCNPKNICTLPFLLWLWLAIWHGLQVKQRRLPWHTGINPVDMDCECHWLLQFYVSRCIALQCTAVQTAMKSRYN